MKPLTTKIYYDNDYAYYPDIYSLDFVWGKTYLGKEFRNARHNDTTPLILNDEIDDELERYIDNETTKN